MPDPYFFGVATKPMLVFFQLLFSLPARYDDNRFLASCTVVIFPLSDSSSL